MPPPYVTVTVPQSPDQIEAALVDLALTFPSLCTRIAFPNRSVEDRPIHFIRIADGSAGGPSGRPSDGPPGESPDGRPVVVLTGGVHARESAPPDALVHFAQNLLVSRSTGTDITFPAMVCTPLPTMPPNGGPPVPVSPVEYPRFTIPAAKVRRFLERVDLYIAPLINPDGRQFDQDNHPVGTGGAGWRKNRRPDPDPARIGVDINRNHDIAWKFEDYYDMAVYRKRYSFGPASTDPANETYRGPAAASEPETANVQWLIDEVRAAYFVDVHQFGRNVLLSWGIEDNGDDPAMNFSSPAWKGRRDGLRPGSPLVPPDRPNYQEFVTNTAPHFVRDRLPVLANAMRDAILRSAGVDPAAPVPVTPEARRVHSTYDVGQSAALYDKVNGGPVTGTTDDYAFRRQFDDPGRAPVFAFTIETGHLEEAGFHPDYGRPPGHYAKIEREVHAALAELCEMAA
ncbi:M14 family zinc carboxypeptidase [Kitasatospora sp. NPDC093806]|uniref:M14 family zinc carboxypeptidase n=1 Tax=Kitasatospora sp. NPDC093806 TaxID=3155075 RepID=UPI0034486AE2